MSEMPARSAETVTDEPDRVEEAPPAHHHFEWWHREHPTFTALSGFFTGLAFVSLVPGIFVWVLQQVFSWRTAENAFPFVLLFLLIPVGLLLWPQSRRFGKYMLFGIVVTSLVVLGSGSVVFWLMSERGL